MKKPAPVIILIALLLWSVYHRLGNLPAMADLAQAGGASLTPFASVALLVLEIASLVFLFRPKPIGWWVVVAATGAAIVDTVVTMARLPDSLSAPLGPGVLAFVYANAFGLLAIQTVAAWKSRAYFRGAAVAAAVVADR